MPYLRGFIRFRVAYHYRGGVAYMPIWARTAEQALTAARRRGLRVTGDRPIADK